MSEFDFSPVIDANKGLSVCFIIIIFIINCLLIYMMIKKNGFLKNAKSHTIISMAIGDIFLALFSLVVLARMYFDKNVSLSCGIQMAANTYAIFLITFVYGVGLVVLAGELVWRYKGKPSSANTSINMVNTIVLSSIPWILGLIVVLPLTMAGIDYDCSSYISSTSSIQAMFGVSVILPAVLAVVVCFVVLCIRFVPLTSHTITYQGATPGVVLATHSMSIAPQQNPVNAAVSAPQVSIAPTTMPYSQPANQNLKFDDADNTPNSTQHYPPPVYSTQPYIPPQYAAGQYLPPPHQAQHGNQSPVIIATPTYTFPPQTTAALILQDPGREKNALMAISVTYSICVVPFSAFMMAINDYPNQRIYATEIDFPIYTTFFWLSLFRSIITPIMWMIFSRK